MLGHVCRDATDHPSVTIALWGQDRSSPFAKLGAFVCRSALCDSRRHAREQIGFGARGHRSAIPRPQRALAHVLSSDRLRQPVPHTAAYEHAHQLALVFDRAVRIFDWLRLLCGCLGAGREHVTTRY